MGKKSKHGLDLINKISSELMKTKQVKIGIIGSKDSRPDGESNASIGYRHEFGYGVPQRSFLRSTINRKEFDFRDTIQSNTEKIREQIAYEGIDPVLAKMGAWWVDAILETFEFNGFGKWKQLEPSTIEAKTRNGKRGDAILTDEGFLKRAIAFEVVD